jgi:threonine dehydratase
MIIPTCSDVQRAAQRLAGQAVRTPLMRSPALDEQTGRQLFFKPECLQRTGSFKFRGAFNRLSQLTREERSLGVIAWSSGNHAQGVACAAQQLGINARIVMPADAPAIKRRNTEAYGATVIPYDRYSEDREAIAYALAERDGGIIVPSFDDPFIIAGQGTVGLELFEDAAAQGIVLDALVVCCSGGGLVAGCALAAEVASPSTAIYCVEPVGFDDHRRSLQSGLREHIDNESRSICDALLAPMPGELTFAINKQRLAGGLAVSDEAVRQAMIAAFDQLKLVVEPGGAVGLAAMLENLLPESHQRVGVVLSGGNVDPQLFASILDRANSL